MIITKNQQTLILILIAFTFSIVIRLIWVQQFAGVESFKFNNEFMINTNDGYYYAEGARDILLGVTENSNDLSPFESATSRLTAFFAKILPFSFETIIFYMPAFLSSLIVIPLILIGRTLGKLEIGFVSALIASIAWSYYNRTMVGYYDTDMLTIVFPTILLWSLIWAINTQENKYLLFTGLDIIAYRWWYPQSYSLEFAFFGLIALYVAYQFIKKEKFQYNLTLITFMMFAMMGLDGYIRFIVIVALFLGLKYKREIFLNYLYYLFGLSLLLFLVTGGFDPIWGQLKGYVFKDAIQTTDDGLKLHFFSVVQTIREAGQIPFETFANRISGDTYSLIISMVGYLFLVYKHRVMLLGLPMLGLGFLALSGGLRFTIYAVPIMALGVGYLIVIVSKFLSKQLINDKAGAISYYILIMLFTVSVLYPNIKHVQGYKVPTVFTNQEVKVLDKLKNIADREDYVIGWWDYGYPIRYYADVKTLSDGGKHSGTVNFPTSFILTNPLVPASKMLRLDVEYTEIRFRLDNSTKWASSNIEQMTVDYNFSDTNDFLESLNNDIKLPKKTRDIFLYLPNRMMNILPTVTLFSNIDLMNGNKKSRPFFYKTNKFKESGKDINLGNNIILDKKSATITIGKQKIRINNFAITAYNKKGQLQKKVQTVDKGSPINVIFMKNYNLFLVLDNKMYNSLYIQLFVLENYDKKLFEPVIFDPLAKVYKLKI